MVAYGNIVTGSASTGFTFTGDSFYQGAGVQIRGPAAVFNYGGVLTGGVSGTGQSADPYQDAVVVNGGSTSSITLNALHLGTKVQNTNVMGVGTTVIQVPTTAVSANSALFADATTVINPNFVPSHLFARAQGGNLELAADAGTGNNFYWPGLLYLSTVKAGTLATVDPTLSITNNNATPSALTVLSNALPMLTTGGEGIYLMSGNTSVARPATIVINAGSDLGLTSLTLDGMSALTSTTPTGSILTYGTALPMSSRTVYVPPTE